MDRDDRRSFTELVADAIAHLHDLPYLQVHPLSELIVNDRAPRRSSEIRGMSLQRALRDAVSTLKPDKGAVDSSHTWRIYRYLFLRFVQVMSPHEVASELAISDRQSRRVYREAIDALASVLWDRYHEQGAESGKPIGTAWPRILSNAPAIAASPSARNASVLDQEVHHLMTTGRGRSSDLGQVIDGLHSIVDPLARQCRSSWSASLPSRMPRIAADRTVVRQILLNLLIAFVERKYGHLALSAEVSQKCLRVILIFRQPTEALAQHQQGSVSEDRLSVSRRLIEAEGGSLKVYGSSDVTLRVEVEMPIEQRSTVLVVDDNSDVVTVFRRYLESAGYEVIGAETGADGFRLAKEERPAVMTLDVMMAAQDGWETLQRLKNDPDTLDTPVIICSVLRENALARFLGAAELLPKPVMRADLLAAVQRCEASASIGPDRSKP